MAEKKDPWSQPGAKSSGMDHSMHRKDGKVGTFKDGKIVYEDLGHKDEPLAPISEGKVRYPCLFITAKDLPQLAAAKLGEEITLAIKAKVKRMSKDDRGVSLDLEVRKAGLV